VAVPGDRAACPRVGNMLKLKVINYIKRLKNGAIEFSYGATGRVEAVIKKLRSRVRFFESNTLRYVFTKVTGNFFFKLLLASVLFLSVITTSVFYFEKNYHMYKFVDGKMVEDTSRKSNITTLKDAIWWTFVTATTTGYGDYYPISSAGRFSGILLMFFGIVLAGVVTGNIASALVEKQLKEGRGLKDIKLKNHFIICGWKRDMPEILYNIMEKNRNFLASEIVLINMADPAEIDNLRSDSRFSHVNYIHGDYIDERVLNRANLKDAARVIIFADRMIQGSIQEVDSRTVMTVITIKSISKTVYVCAELLDEKFERYLRFSNCDEIIMSTEYNRSIIANASSGSGISQVISELLNVNADVAVLTHEIPARFIGRTFGELFDFYLAKNRTILIGILENTGNFYTRKNEAIRDAQKTPDISKLVDNLKVVKQLVANMPVINPTPDYVITRYTRAIIIEGRMPGLLKKSTKEKANAIV
jgi:voltage-gated potassium channel